MPRIPVIVGVREPLIRRRVRDLLHEEPDFEVVADCEDGLQVLDELRSAKPEALLLDVAMPRLDGFGIVRQLDPDRMPAIVFLASSGEQAEQAFDVGALDYLRKPIDRRRFTRSLQRIRAWVRAQRVAGVSERLSGLLQQLRSAADYPSRIPVPTGTRVLFLPVDEIDWIEGSGNYACIRAGGQVHRLRRTLTSLEAMLDPGRFRRIHRGTIVNLARIREIEPAQGGSATVRLSDGSVVRLSRGYRYVLSWLGADLAEALTEDKGAGVAAESSAGEPAAPDVAQSGTES